MLLETLFGVYDCRRYVAQSELKLRNPRLINLCISRAGFAIVLGDVINPASISHRRNHRQSSVVLKYAQQFAIAVIAFVVAIYLLHRMIPSPTIPSNVVFVGPKYDYYTAHKDDYNTLFFGSSRVFNQVIPDVFDRTAQAGGLDINSYNFGIPAMRALDSTALIETVLRNPPKNLKWVFFESVLDRGYEPIHNARTHRAMYWHTWENTDMAVRYILDSEASLPEKAVLIFSHLIPALYNQMNVGRLFNQLLPSEFSAREQMVASYFTEHGGFFPLNEEDSLKRQAFLKDQAGYAQKVNQLEAFQVGVVQRESELAKNKRRLISRVSRAIRATGAEPIFIDPPSLELDDDLQAARRLNVIETLLSYKDPARFPELYQAKNRYDADHLNEATSEVFTRILAEDFSEAIKTLSGRE